MLFLFFFGGGGVEIPDTAEFEARQEQFFKSKFPKILVCCV
jgi:hypothetical protein